MEHQQKAVNTKKPSGPIDNFGFCITNVRIMNIQGSHPPSLEKNFIPHRVSVKFTNPPNLQHPSSLSKVYEPSQSSTQMTNIKTFYSMVDSVPSPDTPLNFISCKIRYIPPNTQKPANNFLEDGRPILYYRVFPRWDLSKELDPAGTLSIHHHDLEGSPHSRDMEIETDLKLPTLSKVCWANLPRNLDWPQWCRLQVSGPMATLFIDISQKLAPKAVINHRRWPSFEDDYVSGRVERWLEGAGPGPWKPVKEFRVKEESGIEYRTEYSSSVGTSSEIRKAADFRVERWLEGAEPGPWKSVKDRRFEDESESEEGTESSPCIEEPSSTRKTAAFRKAAADYRSMLEQFKKLHISGG